MRELKLACALCGLVAVALVAAAPAAARKAFVADSGEAKVSVIETATNSQEGTIHVGTEPVDVAITPDGARAYVVNQGAGTVSVIDASTDASVGAIPVGSGSGSHPRGIAITPDGSRAYVSNSSDGTVSVIDTASDAVVGAPISVGAEPDGVAASADGRFVFVAQQSGDISIIATSSNDVVGTVPDSLTPLRIAVGSRGGRAFVVNKAGSVTVFNPANGSLVGAPIGVGLEPAGIAVTPGGTTAYVTKPGEGTLMEIDASLDSVVGTPISGFPGAYGIAFEPGGQRALVTDAKDGGLNLLDATRNVPAGSIPTGSEPTGVAVVPDQGPRASFWVSPVPSTLRRAKRRLTFHGSNSTDSDGKIVNYVWDFGDGVRTEGPSPTRFHKYRRPGTYLATLTVQDEEGCSTERVFTGQTVSCNGSPAATLAIPITILEPTGPVLHLAGPTRQHLRGRVKLRALCPRVACSVRAGGFLETAIESGGPVRRGKRKLGGSVATLSAGAWRGLSVRIPGGAKRAARRVLRSGGEAVAKVIVIATDSTGSETEEIRKVKLVLP